MTTHPRIALYIDPPSHHFRKDRLFDVGGAALAGDQLLAPYAYLREHLLARGVDVHTADLMPPPAADVTYVYVSMGILSNYRAMGRRPDAILSAYFAMECPIVEPTMYRALNGAQRHFRRIFTWSDSRSLERFVGAQLRCEHFCWPQSFDDVHEHVWRNQDRAFLVMINANKLPRLYWNELYTERVRAVEFFARTGEIDLYGKGWDQPSIRVGRTRVPYLFRRWQHTITARWQAVFPDPLLTAARRAWRGIARSKSETLGRYRFALCFENAILPGWITEKIFDCFFAGTVPVYLGAPDITRYVPPECFVDMRHFSGYEDLRRYLRTLNAGEIREYREQARAFLQSPAFYPFSKASFAALFDRIIEEDAGVSLNPFGPPVRICSDAGCQ